MCLHRHKSIMWTSNQFSLKFVRWVIASLDVSTTTINVILAITQQPSKLPVTANTEVMECPEASGRLKFCSVFAESSDARESYEDARLLPASTPILSRVQPIASTIAILWLEGGWVKIRYSFERLFSKLFVWSYHVQAWTRLFHQTTRMVSFSEVCQT